MATNYRTLDPTSAAGAAVGETPEDVRVQVDINTTTGTVHQGS